MKNPFYYAFGAFWLLTLPLQAQEKEIFVEKVTNSVVIGPVAGNRGLEFGVKNILEEFLLEKEYGKEKGKAVFYASENKGTIKGVKKKGKSLLS